MRLASLALSNFRSCEDVAIAFADDVTVIAGENAAGKSAVIDALRLATTPAIEGSSLGFSAELDPTRGTDKTTEVAIAASYDALTTGEKAIYLAELVDSDDVLTYGTSYSRDPDLPYWRSARHSVGQLGVDDPEPINRKRIAHVYLPPLRDAIIAEVLKVLTSSAQEKPKREEFMIKANAALSSIASSSFGCARA